MNPNRSVDRCLLPAICNKIRISFLLRFSIAVLMLLGILGSRSCHAFWAQGHHAIAVLAFEKLSPEDQAELIRILKQHPRFEQDFKIPESIRGNQRAIDRWWIGVAGEWPDLIRGNETYDRPTWHYQLGATLVIGDVDYPEDPGPLPEGATLATQELYIVQAIELCHKVFHDKTQSDADRAIALCWLTHLVADAHQPCHAGSLYSEKAFPQGDRGANAIPVKVEGQPNIKNLHAFWDSLLGAEATPESVEARVTELAFAPSKMLYLDQELGVTADQAKAAADLIESIKRMEKAAIWIRESRQIARAWVYRGELITNVQQNERGLVSKMPDSILKEDSIHRSLKLIRLQAVKSAGRLASVLTLAEESIDSGKPKAKSNR
ncbi:S1/P1 nuclease [Rhodopirellula sp.]|nr:S1/P1 nuclease [Rhodopirellula sp.]